MGHFQSFALMHREAGRSAELAQGVRRARKTRVKAIKGQDYTPRTKETRVGKEEEMPDLVSTLPCPSSGTQPLEPYTWAALAQV